MAKDIKELETEIINLKEEVRKLTENVTNINKNIFRQIEMYNQHIANLHVKMMG